MSSSTRKQTSGLTYRGLRVRSEGLRKMLEEMQKQGIELSQLEAEASE